VVLDHPAAARALELASCAAIDLSGRTGLAGAGAVSSDSAAWTDWRAAPVSLVASTLAMAVARCVVQHARLRIGGEIESGRIA
jgi:hypothetical protein